MVDFGTPYAMDGTVIPGAGLRRQLQQSAGPGSGVLRPGDFRISQLDVPGAGVKVAAGDDLVQCRAPGRDRETYGVPLYSSQNYMGDSGSGIPGTGSGSGRRDMIVHEILDPDLPRHYTPVESWPAGQYSKLTVVPGVPAGAKTVADVPALNEVTCYELAAINWPASTATITNAMIEDLRVVQSPRELTKSIHYALYGDETNTVTQTSSYPEGGQTWPAQAESSGSIELDVPVWATHAQIEATFYGVEFPGGDAYGVVWVQVGATANPANVKTQNTRWDADNVAGKSRATLGLADEIAIPAALRGSRQKFYPRATRISGTNASTARMDRVSSLKIRVTFQERSS